MKKQLILAGAASLLALFVAGCETDGGIAARMQEKSTAYATRKPWEKSYVDKGVIAAGFTPDMVYMAMGHPTKMEAQDTSGDRAELWTYGRFYPNVDATRGFNFASYSRESAYQPQMPTTQTSAGGRQVPLGMSGTPESIAKTGGPQGGSMEPGDLRSFTIVVLFKNGTVARTGATESFN